MARRELPEEIRSEVDRIRGQMRTLANELTGLERRAFEAEVDEAIAKELGVAAAWLESAARHEIGHALGEPEP